MHMNFEERKNVLYRLVGAFLLLGVLALTSIAVWKVIVLKPEEMTLTLIAMVLTAAVIILQTGFLLKGWKKESNLYKIAFNDNRHVNNIPLIAVIVGTVFGAGLLALGISAYYLREELTIKCSMLVVVIIGSYLFANCLIYLLYLFLFKNRPVELKDLIK